LSAVDSFHCAGDRGLAAKGKGKITRVLAWPLSEYVKELNCAGKALLISAVEKSGRRWLVYKTSAPAGNCMSAAAPSILLMHRKSMGPVWSRNRAITCITGASAQVLHAN